MRVVLALDKFKGTFSASQVCEALAEGIRARNPKIEVVLRPMADGGDGTAVILSQALGLEALRVPVPDLGGKMIDGAVYWQNARRIALVESAEVLGAARGHAGHTPRVLAEPLFASHSGGLGRLLHRAFDLRPQEIWIGIGGTLTADGGWGLAHALGLRAVDDAGRIVEPALENVDRIDHFSPPEIPEFFRKTRLVALCDVNAPARGHGVTLETFLPQKGASPESSVRLMKAIATLWAHLRRVNPELVPLEDAYTGAGGGLVLGLQALFPQLRLELGARKVAQATALGPSLQLADIAVCGEGGLDATTHCGKASSVVSALAREHHAKVLGVFGHINPSEQGEAGRTRLGCEKVFSLFDAEVHAPLPELARQSMRRFHEVGGLIAQEAERAR